MNFDEDDEWDLDLIDSLVRQEEEAIAARRGCTQAAQFSQPPLPFLLKHQVKEAAVLLKTQTQSTENRPQSQQSHHHHHHHPHHYHHRHHEVLLEEANDGEHLKSTVSQLQQRVLVAEKEAGELRRKAVRPIVISSSNTDQELERLREQILFKDQEILEARRAWTEKTEELKRVKCEVQDLKKQFDENNLRVKREEGRVKTSLSSAPSSQGAPHGDAWYTPWKLSGPGASKSNGSPTVQSQTTHLERLQPSAVEELKARTCDNGCSPSSQKDAKLTGRSQQDVIAKSSKSRRKDDDERKGYAEDGTPCRYVDPEKLLKIWHCKGMKEGGLGLISKIFTVCQGDIQILLSKGTTDAEDTGMPLKFSSKEPSPGAREAKHAIREELNLQSILVKIANGFLSTWSLFVALLELSEVGNVQTLKSTLRVLHCILIHDEGCQSKIFGRIPWHDDASKFPEDFFVHRDFGHPGYPVHERKSYCSPRIYHFPLDTQLKSNEQSVDESQGVINRKYGLEKQSQHALIMTIFKRILHHAKYCCSEPARTMAMSILVLLLVNTEPINLRESFGFILFDGTISRFLKKSAGMEVQSQAVRIVQILLHCPSILRNLCTSEEMHSHATELKTASNTEGKSIEQDTSSRYSEMATGKRKLEDQAEAVDTASDVEHNGMEVLEGLISCLICAGNTLQAYSLQRNVLRVLTFIATSGREGALFLFSKDLHFAIDQDKKNNTSKESTSVAPCSLPAYLMSLLDEQLKAEEEERNSTSKATEMEERACIVHEALTLVCRLVSNPVVSAAALAGLTANKTMTRFSIMVANKLISRGTLSEALQMQGKHVIVSADMIELSRGLRRRILDNAPHHRG